MNTFMISCWRPISGDQLRPLRFTSDSIVSSSLPIIRFCDDSSFRRICIAINKSGFSHYSRMSLRRSYHHPHYHNGPSWYLYFTTDQYMHTAESSNMHKVQLHFKRTKYIVPSVLWQEEHPTGKNWVMRCWCWCGCMSGVRSRLFAYGLADAIASQNPIVSCLI